MKNIVGLFLCAGISGSIWILPQLSRHPLWFVALPLTMATILAAGTSPCKLPTDKKMVVLSGVGVIVTIVVTLFYRLIYLRTVPSGTYIGETSFYIELAAKFANEGFSYTPYQGYMHTGYAYLGAVGMLFSSEWDWGFRCATAVVSALTVATSFFAIRALSPRSSSAAWIGAGLLASSPWHIYISRFLMQKFLLPLCESITLLGLIVTVTAFKSSWRYWGALLAAFGFVLGLHSYWGCYVLAATWGTFLVYLIVFHRTRAQACWGPLVVASSLAFSLSLSVMRLIQPELGASGYVKRKFDFGGDVFVDKVIRNIEFLFWTLSSSPSKFGASFVTAPIAFLFLVGLIKAIKQFRSSIPSALITINFAWFFVGIAVTWAHDMYMAGLIFSVYCLAAQGATSMGQTLVGAFGGGRAILFGVVPLVLVSHQAVANYQKAVLSPIYGHSPYLQPAEHLRDEMRAFTATHSVWAPMRGLGQTLWRYHNLKYPEYAFVSKLHTFDANVPLFDTGSIERSAGIELYLQQTPTSEILINETLKTLYPNLVVTPLRAPPPYDQMSDYKAPTGFRVSISLGDVMQLKAAPGTTLGDLIETQGFLAVAREGFYSFCYQESYKPQFIINNEPVEMVPCSEQNTGQRPVFLGTGVHQVLATGQQEATALKILARVEGGPDQPLRDLLWGFATPSARKWANQNRATLGKPTPFTYEVVETFPKIADKLHQVSGLDANTVVLANPLELFTFDRSSQTKQRYLPYFNELGTLGRPGTPLFLRTRGSTKVFTAFRAEMNLVFDSKGIETVDFDQHGDSLALLRGNGTVIIINNGAVEKTISVTPEKSVSAVAWISDTLFVTAPQGIYYRELSTGTSGKIAGDFSELKNLSSDADGNLYAWAPHQKEPTRVFSSSARRLFNATTNSTAIFLDKNGSVIRGISLPKFLSDEVFAAYGTDLLIFRKKPLT